MKRTPTPGRIAFFSSVIISGFYAIFILLLTGHFLHFILVFLVGAVVGYLTIYYFLQQFIYKKIRLIYKSIHRENTRHLILSGKRKDPIATVSEEVAKWASERREEIAQLKSQEGFRREFLGNVSHELKTPIFQIQGYIHTLLEGALADPEVNYRFLKKAGKSADRLAELVNDLNSISNIESGLLSMNPTKFDVVKLMEEVYDDLDQEAKSKQVQMLFKATSNRNLKALGDVNRIKQVMTNLVLNAIQHGRKEGVVRTGVFDMDAYILVEVSDVGEGIPDESLPRLFERFYRVEKSRNRNVGGSGLGLSIAKHIIEAHGQSIQVRSAPGEGATFSFTLAKSKKKK